MQVDAKHLKRAAKLSKAKGADFDRQFMKVMIAAQKDVMNETKTIVGKSNRSMASTASGDAAVDRLSAVGTSGSAPGGAGATDSSADPSSTSGPQIVKQYAETTFSIVQRHLQHAALIERATSRSSS
jgi:hypothetical protein